MKVLVIGATGTIGKAVTQALAARHQVVAAGHSTGDLRVDLTVKSSIVQLFSTVGRVDAVVSTAGRVKFGPLAELSDDDVQLGVLDKLLGQVNLVRCGVDVLNDKGSITLTAGLASRSFSPGSAPISMANAGLEAFVRAAALEMPRGIRLNVVSPGWVLETLQALGMNLEPGIPAAEVAQAYVESVEGNQTGAVIDVGRAA